MHVLAWSKLLAYLQLFLNVRCDIYFHNPRGSNNRLDERGRARNNANRLFDSQNNGRGGYNVGSLYYYGTSVLQIEWTNQHSCGDVNNNCELILQYMCDPQIRDGATIGDHNCDTDLQYGMHENYSYYSACRSRKRNMRLFTADQNLRNRNTARHTRQNPSGTRRGYECPEERDYYPYWHPSPWIDIVVMTNNVSRCGLYQTDSYNVKSRWECVLPTSVIEENSNAVVPNLKEECEAFEIGGVRAEWRRFEAHGVPAPECRETEFTRDNHLGNGFGGAPTVYNWTVPDIDADKCVLRVRYNISTDDYGGWSAFRNQSDGTHRRVPEIGLAGVYGLESEDVSRRRGYILENDPVVRVFDGVDLSLRLALNTAQYGRTFQDRSHTFEIRRRPEDVLKTIYNLNVRGKRGNIVQVYPAVEYDFVPNTLEMTKGDYIHIQWTGSNTNPSNNDGQGLAGTDRNNLVLLRRRQFPEGGKWSFGPGGKYGHYGTNYPEHVVNTTFLGFDQHRLMSLAFLLNGQFRGEMSELDDAGTYFDIGFHAVTSPAGVYHFLCTRNNNFSNRDQKGRVIVLSEPAAYGSIGARGGRIALPDSLLQLIVPSGAFDGLQKLSLHKLTNEEVEAMLLQKNRVMTFGHGYASCFYVIKPERNLTSDGVSLMANMSVSANSGVSLYRSSTEHFTNWVKVPIVDTKPEQISFYTQQGGVFVAVKESNATSRTVGLIVACLTILALVIGSAVYFHFRPQQWRSLVSCCHATARTFSPKV